MSFFERIQTGAQQLASNLTSHLGLQETHSHTHASGKCSLATHSSTNRHDSFAPRREGNDAKWFVDGCGYFWAVSEALENAKETIWIMDWWLSPGQ